MLQLSSPEIKARACLPKKRRIVWEWRSFWKENCPPIPLRMAPFNISSLSDFENVILEDTYVSIGENLLNLKIRKERLVYKPVIEEYGKILAFGPKKKFEFPLGWNKLYPLFPRLRYYKEVLFSPHDLVLCLQESGYQATLVPLQKNAYRYKITENLQLELSHITAYGRHWYSLCVEGLSVTQVRECAHLIISQKGELMGYAEFLNK